MDTEILNFYGLYMRLVYIYAKLESKRAIYTRHLNYNTVYAYPELQFQHGVHAGSVHIPVNYVSVCVCVCTDKWMNK